jgi:hypothetical protein
VKDHRTWIIATFLALCFSVSAPRSLSDNPPPSLSYCDLVSGPQKYDTKVVTTEALVQSNYHDVRAYDAKCLSTGADGGSAYVELPQGWSSTKLGKRLSKILRRDRTARVAFDAIFYASGGPYGQEGMRFRFVMRRLISVEEVSAR